MKSAFSQCCICVAIHGRCLSLCDSVRGRTYKKHVLVRTTIGISILSQKPYNLLASNWNLIHDLTVTYFDKQDSDKHDKPLNQYVVDHSVQF